MKQESVSRQYWQTLLGVAALGAVGMYFSDPERGRLQWIASLTESIRPSVLAWKTDPGAAVEHSGLVRFEPADNGGTRVHVRLSYNPPAGMLGHGVAVLLGTDPKQELDDDLMLMKSFIETGIVPHDAAKPVTTAGYVAP